MLSLRTGAAVDRALSSDIDAELRQLLVKRVEQLNPYGADDIGELVHFLIVEPGDSIGAIEAELGFSPLVNFVDGSRYGDPDFTPSWEWIEQHGAWFEVVFVLSDNGFGCVLLVPTVSSKAGPLVDACAGAAGQVVQTP